MTILHDVGGMSLLESINSYVSEGEPINIPVQPNTEYVYSGDMRIGFLSDLNSPGSPARSMEMTSEPETIQAARMGTNLIQEGNRLGVGDVSSITVGTITLDQLDPIAYQSIRQPEVTPLTLTSEAILSAAEATVQMPGMRISEEGVEISRDGTYVNLDNILSSTINDWPRTETTEREPNFYGNRSGGRNPFSHQNYTFSNHPTFSSLFSSKKTTAERCSLMNLMLLEKSYEEETLACIRYLFDNEIRSSYSDETLFTRREDNRPVYPPFVNTNAGIWNI